MLTVLYMQKCTKLIVEYLLHTKHEVIEDQNKQDHHEEFKFYEMVNNYRVYCAVYCVFIIIFSSVYLDSTAS